ncbi:hypothetical protein G7054_g9124 [Neopestalotiopsis clavispora]|nr:hypothetical protein G7054_g9124 [Neopestalotiopsis clavispora]
MANDEVSISMKSVLQATTNPYHDDEWATQTRQSSKRKATAFSFAALLGSLAVGLLLAIGHDLFYRSLEGRSINSVDLSQQWVSRIGTGFAFLVKASLVNAIIIAYTQRLWRKMQTRALEVGKIDHLMAAPTNILSLLHFAAFFQAPDLLVPQLSFNGTAWATRLIGKTYFSYANPSDEVRRCALAAAMTGSVLNIPHSFPNSSYHLDFWGPTIQCSSANESITQAVDKAWWDSVGSGGSMTYLSWVGNDDHNILNDSYASLSGQWETLDETSKDVARIFLAYNYNQGFDTIECQLHNSSYSVDFTFVNGQVSTSILSLAQSQPLPALRNVGTYDDDWMTGANGVHVSYQSVMDAFGKIFTGYAHTGGEKSSSMIQTSFSLTYVSWTDLNKTQRELEQLFQNMTLSMFSSPTLS